MTKATIDSENRKVSLFYKMNVQIFFSHYPKKLGIGIVDLLQLSTKTKEYPLKY